MSDQDENKIILCPKCSGRLSLFDFSFFRYRASGDYTVEPCIFCTHDGCGFHFRVERGIVTQCGNPECK